MVAGFISILSGVVVAQNVSYSVLPLTSPFNPPGYVTGNQLNNRHWVPLTDNLTGRQPQAVLWRWGQAFPLSLFGGACSTANGINDYGHIVGSACLPGENLPHAYLYLDKRAIDLGTFGGVSAIATNVNLSRQVAGTYHLSDGTVHTFEWQRKSWVDVGNLGGSFTYPFGLNNSGAISGQSDVSNVPDPVFGIPHYHGFQWVGGVLTDFGQIFGSDFNFGYAINNAGMIAGGADTAGDLGAHALIWNKGAVQDLTPGMGSGFNGEALGINNMGQVVGIVGSVDDPSFGPPVNSVLCPCYGVLWQSGQEIFLNDLVPAGWSIYLPVAINDHGYIVAVGKYNGGQFQRLLLRPVASPLSTSLKAITMQKRAETYPAGGPRALQRHGRVWSETP
jgi:probable HAF family extracellular repeat protein